MIVSATMTAKNQVTIPKAIRDLLNLKRADTLEFVVTDEGQITLEKQESNANLWDVVAQQEKEYGSIDTPEFDWGSDVGTEVID
ncbi:type II toxin-antitoxin system PrlF family antitoxin [Ligilactobacillus hohenheimensis]|uniref:type II toxin-antitoxin system PrlF family antitoxin n=1 Tax=Ligilactobacillus hohenheimensis TaxID=2991832 RepID=UPI0024BB303C|nr:type II toxin-antitoxin system PrlF family antitoxin [Ligilactobacillus hohenheimensis]